MSPQLLAFVAAGTIAMLAVAFLCRPVFQLSVLKTVLLTLCLTVAGVAGVALLFFVENGRFGGVSFFGAVLLVPLLLFPLSRLLRLSYPVYLDLAAPMVSVMLAVMKVNCYLSGCCQGKVLYHDAAGQAVRFPSQLTELGMALLLAVILIVCIKGGVLSGLRFPLFMILYSVTRFVMNFLRETEPFVLGMAAGNFWAIISTLAGLVWFGVYYMNKRGKTGDGPPESLLQ